MKKYLSLFVVLIMAFAAIASTALAEDNGSSNKDWVACTMDAKMCPDGSSVGRSGPNCEFAKCPGENNDDKSGSRREEMTKDSNDLRDNVNNRFQNLRDEIKNEKDTVKARIKDARITGRENALQHFDAAVTRISNLKDRVNSQIGKFEAKGVNVSSARSFVATSEVKLSAARGKIAEMNSILSVSTNELSKDNRSHLLSLAQDAQGLIKDARQALIDAIKSLKAGVTAEMRAEADSNKD